MVHTLEGSRQISGEDLLTNLVTVIKPLKNIAYDDLVDYENTEFVPEMPKIEVEDELTDREQAKLDRQRKLAEEKLDKQKQIAEENPQYLLWLSGKVTMFSLKTEAKEIYEKLKIEKKEDLEIIKQYVEKSICKVCLIGDCKRYDECKNLKSKTKRNYEYHPYGKKRLNF